MTCVRRVYGVCVACACVWCACVWPLCRVCVAFERHACGRCVSGGSVFGMRVAGVCLAGCVCGVRVACLCMYEQPAVSMLLGKVCMNFMNRSDDLKA